MEEITLTEECLRIIISEIKMLSIKKKTPNCKGLLILLIVKGFVYHLCYFVVKFKFFNI